MKKRRNQLPKKKQQQLIEGVHTGSEKDFFLRTEEKRWRSFLRDERLTKDVVFCVSDAQTQSHSFLNNRTRNRISRENSVVLVVRVAMDPLKTTSLFVASHQHKEREKNYQSKTISGQLYMRCVRYFFFFCHFDSTCRHALQR